MTHLYRVYGVEISSELELPLPALSESEESVSVEVREFSIPEPETWDWEFVQLPSSDGPCCWELQTLSGQRVLRVELAAQGESLRLSHCQFVNQTCLRDILLHPLLAHLARRRGALALHASVLEFQGRAFALLGDSGEGKSTLAWDACAREARLVADDVALLREGAEGWKVFRGPTGIRLEREAEEEHRVFDLKRIPWPQAASRKWEHAVPSTALESLPLAGLVVLQTGLPGTSVSLEATVSGQQGLLALLRHRFGSQALPSEDRKREFAGLARLAELFPVMTLRRPHGEEFLGQQVEALERFFRASVDPAEKAESS